MRARWERSRLLLLSVIIALGIGALVAFQLMQSRAAIWQRALAANTNLLSTVSHVLAHALEDADQRLLQTINIIETAARTSSLAYQDGWQGKSVAGSAVSGISQSSLFAAQPEFAMGIQLVLDEHGRVLRASAPIAPEDSYFADRSYFAVHRNNAHVGRLHISPPFLSRNDGEPSVAVSRRWNQEDGSFGGVVVQALRLSELNELFRSIALGPESGINVMDEDGHILLRFPYSTAHVGQSLAGTANFERFVREGQGHFTGVAAIDQVERLYTFRTLDNFPIILNIAQSTDTILNGWRRSALWLGGTTLLLMFACIALALYAERQLRAHRRTTGRLRKAEHELRILIDSLPALVAYWDRGLVVRMANLTHKRWFGLAPAKIVGHHMAELLGAEEYESLKPHIDATLAGETRSFERTVNGTNGDRRFTSTTFIPDIQERRVQGFFVLTMDISGRRAAEESLLAEKERFHITLESIQDAVITTDRNGRIVYLNPAATRMTGVSLDAALGRQVEEVMTIRPVAEGADASTDGGSTHFHWPLRAVLETSRSTQSKGEHLLVSSDGTKTHIEDLASPILDGEGRLVGAVLVFHEVTRAREMAHRMSQLARHDALTGLLNRHAFTQQSEAALEQARAESRRMAVLYMDLDGFKQINDQHGHGVGDDLLRAVSGRLQSRLRDGDTLFRLGGDEFVVLMEQLDAPEDSDMLATRLVQSCHMPFEVSGRALKVTLSVGICVFPDDAEDLPALIERADQALYMAKDSGRNCSVRATHDMLLSTTSQETDTSR